MKKTVFALMLWLAACGSGVPGFVPPPISEQVNELGFYVLRSGTLTKVEFREYGSGPTHRNLPQADFADIPTLTGEDALVLYGDLPEGPLGTTVSVFCYIADGSDYRSVQTEVSLESFFNRQPLDPVRGVALTKLTPREHSCEGVLFLHRYVGMSGDAYLPFRANVAT